MQHSNSILKLITIVIPCLNEQQSISTLYYELKNVQKEMPRSYRWETLFVDDGPRNVAAASELGMHTFCPKNGEDWTSEIYEYLNK